MLNAVKLHGSDYRLLLSVLLLGALLAVAGCNTIEGMGEDVEAAGGAMSDTADDTEDEM